MNRPLRKCKHPGCRVLTDCGYCQEHKPKIVRKESQAWHYLYTSPRFGWQRRRLEQLRLQPFCQMCGAVATDVDHVVPHKGDVRLFCTGQLQSLCHSCHSAKTMRENLGNFNTARKSNA